MTRFLLALSLFILPLMATAQTVDPWLASEDDLYLNYDQGSTHTYVYFGEPTSRTQYYIKLTSPTPTWDFNPDLPAGEIPALGGNPTVDVDGTAVNGSATTYLRSDGAPALADPFTPADGDQNITGGLHVSDGLRINGTWQFQSETEGGTERLTLRAVGANDAAEIFLHPTGSANTSRITVSDNVNTVNYDAIAIEATTTENTIESVKAGTGTAQPLKLKMDGTDIITVQQDGDVIFENGNIGVGDTSPDAKMEIVAASGIQLLLTNTEGVDDAAMTVNGSGYLTIDTSGNRVLVPESLWVQGGSSLANTTNSLVVGEFESATATARAVFESSSGSPNAAIAIEESSGAERWQIGVNVTGDLEFFNSADTADSMTFDDSGNIIIADGDLIMDSSDPDITANGTLQVHSNADIELEIDADDDGTNYMHVKDGSGSTSLFEWGDDGYFYVGPHDTDGSWRLGQSGDDLIWQQRESGTWNTKVTHSGA